MRLFRGLFFSFFFAFPLKFSGKQSKIRKVNGRDFQKLLFGEKMSFGKPPK